jgi:hypothetical protein
MSITKLDVAEREIVAAVRLLFDGNDTVPVYVLAAAARDITTTLCNKRGLPSMIDAMYEEHPHLSRDEIIRWTKKHANFFKHADRDHDKVLEGFEATDADEVLYIACFDFGRLCGGKPVEADAFELWFYAMRDLCGPMRIPDIVELRGIMKAPRSSQIAMGRKLLARARADAPATKHYSTE